MILRKPYAFFIKYFRVINLIMALLMAFLIYRTFMIGRFFTNYVNDYMTATNGFSVGNYVNFYIYLAILLVIILTIIVLSVVFIKNKPKKLYIFNLILYLAIFILYLVNYNVLNSTTEHLLDIRVSKALQDINYIAVAIQAVSFIITLIRATGFDLKQFEFGKDLQELQIVAKDNEEFEVAIEVDKNKLRRTTRGKYRELKYFYIENKFFVNLSIVILLIIIIFFIVLNKLTYTKNYKENQTFSASTIGFNIKNSYLTNTDEKGNVIVKGDNILLVVKLDLKKFTDEKKLLNTGLITLKIDGTSYGQTTKYNAYLTDIGTPYVDQNLSQDFENYILTFEIPKNTINKSMTLKINDNISYIRGEMGAQNILIQLKPVNLLSKNNEITTKIGNEMSFSGSVLGESIFKINKIEINQKFKSEYKFCSKKDKCNTSYEYITPSATGSYFKDLMKIEGTLDMDESQNLEINDIYELLTTFGTINYQIDNEWIENEVDSNKIKPKYTGTSTLYIEVNRELEKAQSIFIKLNVRNYTYKYIIK